MRAAAGAAVADRGATVAQPGQKLGLFWPTVWDAVVEHAAAVLPARSQPTPVLGIDELCRGRRRWRRHPDTGNWEVAVDRWHGNVVDVAGGQGLLDQVEGRTS